MADNKRRLIEARTIAMARLAAAIPREQAYLTELAVPFLYFIHLFEGKMMSVKT